MALPVFTDEHESADFKICHDRVELRTQKRVQFIDITELVRERVRRAGISHGVVKRSVTGSPFCAMATRLKPVMQKMLVRTNWSS